jgi:hypothetical protein
VIVPELALTSRRSYQIRIPSCIDHHSRSDPVLSRLIGNPDANYSIAIRHRTQGIGVQHELHAGFGTHLLRYDFRDFTVYRCHAERISIRVEQMTAAIWKASTQLNALIYDFLWYAVANLLALHVVEGQEVAK